MSLIHLSLPTHRLDPDLLDSNGGFLWWYADAVNEQGDGFVVIWSFGLPFLPGYAAAQRAGRAPTARSRPSLTVCIYQGGKLDFYLLQEYAPEDATWDHDGCWKFADSIFESSTIDGQRVLNAQLSMPVPGSDSKFVAAASIAGVARRRGPNDARNSTHDWSPLVGPAVAKFEARHGADNWRFTGRGYHDRNGGRVAMHAQGISRWLWGRIPFDTFERIFYLSWPHHGPPELHGLDILSDGTTRHAGELSVAVASSNRSYTGPTYPRRIELTVEGSLWLSVNVAHVIDEGPFYLRFMVNGRLEGQSALGIAELVLPDAIDSDHLRPLVKMRVHTPKGWNSVWLPLFSGPRRGRIRRLVEYWMSR